MSMFKNTIVNVAGSVIPLVIAILTVPQYLHLIGEERYGVLAVIWLLLGYFGIFDFGLGKATARRMSQIDSDHKRSELFSTVLFLTLFLGVIGGMVLLIFSEWILAHLFSLRDESKNEALRSILWLPLALILLLLNSAFVGALQARERYVAINAASVLGDSLAQLLPLLVAWLGYVSIDILLPSVLGARLITSILLLIQCRKHVPIANKLKIDFSHLRPLLGYGGWASALTMIGPLMTVLDRMVIGTLAGAKGVTLFTIPFNLVTKLLILPNSYGMVLFPRLAALSRDESKALADNAGRSVIAFMTPMTILAIGVTHPFMILWLGRDFADRCTGIGELILLGVWMNAAVMPYSYYLYAEARLKTKILVISLLEVPLYFFFLWVGVKYFGVLGAAAAWSLRVAIDAICFLMLADALKIIWFALISLSTVVMAALAVYYFDVFGLWRWCAIVMLIGVSFVIHRKICVDAYDSLFSRRT